MSEAANNTLSDIEIYSGIATQLPKLRNELERMGEPTDAVSEMIKTVEDLNPTNVPWTDKVRSHLRLFQRAATAIQLHADRTYHSQLTERVAGLETELDIENEDSKEAVKMLLGALGDVKAESVPYTDDEREQLFLLDRTLLTLEDRGQEELRSAIRG